MKKTPQAPLNNPRSQNGATPSIIGSDVVIEGSLQSQSEVQLDGRIRGNLVCGALVMGEKGHVTGDIKADTVTIRGRIEGDVRARVVQLQQTAVVDGDVYHESLTVEAGAKLNGRFTHGVDTGSKSPALPLEEPDMRKAAPAKNTNAVNSRKASDNDIPAFIAGTAAAE